MKQSSLAIPFLLVPGLAMADVAAEDVWTNMQALYGAWGAEMSGSTARSGDTFTVTDAVLAVTFPVIEGGVRMTLPDMTLVDLGDGTVSISMPDTYLIEVTATIPQMDGPITADVAVSQPGMQIVASGEPRDVTYVSDLSSYEAILNNLVVPGEDFDVTVAMESAGYAGESRVTVDGDVTMTSNMTYGATTTIASFTADAIGQSSTTNSDSMSVQATAVFPPDINILDLTPALKAGLSVDMTFDSGGSTSSTTTTFGGEPSSEQLQIMGPSNYRMTIDESGFAIIGEGADAAIEMSDQNMFPVPLSFSIAGSMINVAIPLVASDDPQPFSYAISLTGLELSDGLWGMFDPAAALDRTPADLVFDVSGTLGWGLDTLNIPALMEMSETGAMPPISIESLDINAIDMTALGAMVAASGAFTFDNSDMATFGGMPRPEGSATAKATGLNGMIDQLVGAGLLPEDQAGMGRMFMGMFAQSTGDDALESTVEVDAEGGVYLNGQRMR